MIQEKARLILLSLIIIFMTRDKRISKHHLRASKYRNAKRSFWIIVAVFYFLNNIYKKEKPQEDESACGFIYDDSLIFNQKKHFKKF